MRVVKWGLGLLGLAAVGVIGLAAIGFGGSASAQTPTPDQSTQAQHALQVFADKLGVSVDDVTNAAKATRDQLVDEAVNNGQITSEQGDQIKSMDVGSFLRFRRHPLASRVGKAIGGVFQEAANYLHLTVDDVRSKLQSGQSLADIATAQNVDPAALKADLMSKITQETDQALAEGKISQQAHDRIEQNLSQRLDTLINHKGGTGAKFRGRFGGNSSQSQ